MARPGRPASESYQPLCYSGSQSISFSSEAGTAGTDEEDPFSPIFSLSKSSMDVVMATGPPHKRDPAWTTMDLRRSCSTSTPAEQNAVTQRQLHPHVWQHISATNSHHASLTSQNVEVHSPPAIAERWITNMQRWSQCSTQSRSSTPDTIIWKGGTSRPSSQETPYSAAPDSPVTKPTATSPFISPLQTPTLPPEDLLAASSSLVMLNTHQHKDLFVASSPTASPLLPPLQPHPSSSPLASNSPNFHQHPSTEDEGFLENNLLSFTFPSPIPSSVSLSEGGASSDPGCIVDEVIEKLNSPGSSRLSDGGVRSPAQMSSCLSPSSPAKGQESRASLCYLELPGRKWKSPLVSSVSDSQLGECCRCNLNPTRAPKGEMFKEEGTMTSQLELVDTAVQTMSPVGSLWGLRRNTSNMGSHSILGSPPGSRLNLKSPVGSHSNLVSPSSSMFPVSSGEEEERRGETWNSALPHDLDRRRSCLKIQGDERDELGRRSSMKQVQWDEDGMTWDIHGASVDPEVLNMAIQKHLDVQNSPRPERRASKKKKAPKPPLISNVVKAMTPELNPPVTIITSTCSVEGESQETPDGSKEVAEEVKTEETVEAARRISRAEGDNVKEEEEVYGQEGAIQPKSPSREKKSVIRSFRRHGWCGGSKKTDD